MIYEFPKLELQNVYQGTEPPPNAVKGDVYINTVVVKTYVCVEKDEWVELLKEPIEETAPPQYVAPIYERMPKPFDPFD